MNRTVLLSSKNSEKGLSFSYANYCVENNMEKRTTDDNSFIITGHYSGVDISKILLRLPQKQQNSKCFQRFIIQSVHRTQIRGVRKNPSH